MSRHFMPGHFLFEWLSGPHVTWLIIANKKALQISAGLFLSLFKGDIIGFFRARIDLPGTAQLPVRIVHALQPL